MNKSLYGIYPGKLKYDSKYIKECSEMELFIQVNNYLEKEEILKYYDYCNKMKDFYIKCEDYSMVNHFEKQLNQYESIRNYIIENKDETEYALDFCILQTARYNTNVKYNPNGRIIRTEEFNEWYEKFKLYSLTLNKETMEFYKKCRYESKGLQYFNPGKTVNNEISEENIIQINTVKPYKKEKSIKHNFA